MKNMTRVDGLAAAVVLAWLGVFAATASAVDLLAEADARIESSPLGIPDNNYNDDLLIIKLDSSPGERKIYMRFDLSSVTKPVDEVGLVVTSAQNNATVFDVNFDVYACPDGGICETWDETTITWNNAPDNILIPGFEDVFAYPRQPFDTATKVGSFGVVRPVTYGDFWEMASTPELVAAVNNDTDNTLTLMMAAGDTDWPNGYGPLMASKEHADLRGPILRVDPPPPVWVEWKADRSGDWNEETNWVERGPPNSENVGADFTDVLTSSRTVYTDTDLTVNAVRFSGTSAYVIAGGGAINLMAGTAFGLPPSGVSVLQGSHQFQAAVNINNNVTVDVASQSTLTFNNALNLGGHTLTQTGAGTMNINNQLNTGGGSVIITGGVLGGSGEVGGSVTNQGGTVAPGTSPGTLSIAGDYTQGSGGTLLIEIAGTAEGEYDVLEVVGTATLDGNLDIDLLSFTPSDGDTFDVVTAASMTESLQLTGDDAGFTAAIVGGGALAADFDGNSVVNGLDLGLWQDSFGTGAVGDADGDGDSDGSDFLIWQGEFGSTGGGGGAQILRLTYSASLASAAVPEPATLTLLALGLVGIGMCVTRRRVIACSATAAE